MGLLDSWGGTKWCAPPAVCARCKQRHYATDECHVQPRIWSSAHLRPFIDTKSLRLKIRYAIKALKGHDYDALAFRGMSGALLAPAIAMRTGKSLILVRKDEDSTHSSDKVEGDIAARRYIIVDDFIASGRTYEEIVEAIKKFAPQAKCLGMLECTELDKDVEEKHTLRKGA